MKYLIKVTQEDIDKGLRENSTKCPVALALSKLFPNYSVIFNTCIINGKSYYLPLVVREFIIKFDKGHVVEPFEFELEIN